ncbi:hypothetical protein K7X08_035517 [Anisodus acutangulus]|uniref:non-specific serine/threonine protein kinase n=1 Tax=Anisodus acutangulus TaxID=402998 RepID=A0A9Q1LKW1_9SOLA|nr:hypothetical protein K7X08_035517 [Anisodus acutangulus]
MGTEATPRNSSTLTMSWGPADPNIQYYTYMHFVEIVSLKPNQSRKFVVIINGETVGAEYELEYLTTFVMEDKRMASEFNYTLRRTNKSRLPPLINAFEVYSAKRFFKLHTDENDVDTVMNIKATYDVKKNWDLSSSGLSGEIPPTVSNLTALQYLDLSDNDLIGPVPSFLAGFTSLRFRNLTGNKFWGSIPVALAEKANNGALLLSIDGFVALIPNHCQCTKKKLTIPVAVLLMLSIVVIAICYFTKRKAKKLLAETGYKEFQLEAELLGRVHHRNLISLVGYCYEGANMALVYEYMENGTVKEHLNGDAPKSLTWIERLQVALDAAEGQPHVMTSKNCHIIEWVGNSLTNDDVANIIDPRLEGSYDSELVEKYVRLAISCCSSSSANRPTMHYVASRLEEYLEAAKGATKDTITDSENSTLTNPVLVDNNFSGRF